MIQLAVPIQLGQRVLGVLFALWHWLTALDHLLMVCKLNRIHLFTNVMVLASFRPLDTSRGHLGRGNLKWEKALYQAGVWEGPARCGQLRSSATSWVLQESRPSKHEAEQAWGVSKWAACLLPWVCPGFPQRWVETSPFLTTKLWSWCFITAIEILRQQLSLQIFFEGW